MRDVIFLGAGASVAGEARLPLFADIRRSILEASRIEEYLDLAQDEIASVVSKLAPEALLLVLQRADIDVEAVLLELFNRCCAQPNVVHTAAAYVAANGGSVWTTNYDTLIEEAYARLVKDGAEHVTNTVHSAVPAGDSGPSNAQIVKLHGSFDERAADGMWRTARGLIFSAPKLIPGMPDDYCQRLLQDASLARLWVIGYRGIDIDIMPVLREAIERAAEVRWFLYATDEDLEEWHVLKERYPMLTVSSGSKAVQVSGDPAHDFVRQLTCLYPALKRLTDGRPTRDGRRPLGEANGVHLRDLDRLKLISQLGLASQANRTIGSIVRSPTASLGERTEATSVALRRFATYFRHHRAVRHALRIGAESPLGPAREAFRRLAAEDVRSGEPWPTGSILRRWLEDRWQSEVAVGAVRLLSYEGAFDAATHIAAEGLRRALKAPEHVDQVGSLSFQLGGILRTRGDFESARQQCLRGLATVASTVLALWEEFTRLASTVGLGEQLLSHDVRSAEELMRLFDLVREPGGRLWASLLLAIDAKNREAYSQAEARLRSLIDQAEAENLPILSIEGSIHLADCQRLLGNLSEMHRVLRDVTQRQHLLNVPESNPYQLFSEVVRLAAQDAPAQAWEDLLPNFDRLGSLYGRHIIELALHSGQLDGTVPAQKALRLTFL